MKMFRHSDQFLHKAEGWKQLFVNTVNFAGVRTSDHGH